jgi:AraC-like DNA-binding protein
MSFSLPDILFVIVIFQLLFTSAFLFMHRGGRAVSNGLLGAFFLVIGLNLLDNFLLREGFYDGRPAFAFWSLWLLLLFGPLLYLYTQSVLYRDFRLTWRKGWHFVPFVVLFLITEVYWLALGSEERMRLLGEVLLRQAPKYYYWDSVLIFLQFFLYMAASFRLIWRFKKAAGDAFSNYRRTDIRWLSYTLLFFTVVMGLAAVNSWIGLTPLAAYWWLVFVVIMGFVWVYINVLLLKALRDSALFAVLGEKLEGSEDEKRAGPDQEWNPVLVQLRGHMGAGRPWLDPDLTLEQLASQVKLRPKLLSQAINEGLGKNFFEFINQYRIEEAKRLLTDPADKKITVLEVLYQVGFNSKSSFNTVFKKQTGMTPSEFKKRMGESRTK